MKATLTKIERPKFASEAEEADSYPAHPEYAEQMFEQARLEGRLRRGPLMKRTEMTTPVTLRISQGDLERARAQAEKKGLGYQTYMKMLLREALDKNEG